MLKNIGRSAFWGFCAVLLSACQHTHQAVDTMAIKFIAPEQRPANVKLYCTGTVNCEFERFDSIQIVDDTTHLVNYEAIKKGYVRLNSKTTGYNNALFLTVPDRQHEVVIRFYPISMDRAERISVIHHFKPNTSYTFKMYRNRTKQAGSLLSVSAPDPLCVVLLQDQRPIRRFCKPYNVLTGLGEFVEQKF
ncbi:MULTISPECIES: hypothetical protein [unclassified Acinetobacter]|uniref:hypothetical protein n=1 Tax=unclassified Acinetobacter TaxID=196816 RepID=UPI0002CFC273|nr:MULTISPECIES: hypothetical protein [unclassified Acinetobacter]ENU79391.1 hypothetical protein F975_02635 [Acinetobacter sp. ANC 3789]PVZ89516.1 hypothetical protein C9426_04420 [Serratia sp. S1B]TCB13450.1 hypothetical protein E0H78_02260 [Acinetobacter sp. ANC 4641]TCB84802.1 hypothetical protein E0H90_06410 [Acinetobacter sp. ANC 3791]